MHAPSFWPRDRTRSGPGTSPSSRAPPPGPPTTSTPSLTYSAATSSAGHVKDGVEVVGGPGGGALELGDVPGPDLVRSRGQKLGACIGRATERGLVLGHHQAQGPRH